MQKTTHFLWDDEHRYFSAILWLVENLLGLEVAQIKAFELASSKELDSESNTK